MMVAKDRRDAGRTVFNPSDNPTAYISAYSHQRTINDTKQFQDNAGEANGWHTENNDQIKAALDKLQEIRDKIALNGNNDTNDAESLRALANDVMGAYNILFDIANTKYAGRYLFAGYQTDTLPFVDKVNTVSSLFQADGKGGNVSARGVFADMSELKSGDYTVQIERDPADPSIGVLKLLDRNGNRMILDTNGSDDSLNGGNRSASELTFKIEPGEVLNTGRGISITLPPDINANGETLLKYEFKYEAGTNATYYGDNGHMTSQIGFNQDVGYNFTGLDLFLQNNKILRGGQYNSVGGVPVTASTLFRQLDKANSGIGDSIRVQGTDHNGIPVGSARVTAPENVKLDMTNSSQKERTMTIGYAGKYYQIEVPARGYKDSADLAETMNRLLESAQYVGPQGTIDPADLPIASQTEWNVIQNQEINDLYPADFSNNRKVDLSKEITISTDGDRLSFITKDIGDQTALSITGYKHNQMGFDDKTVGAMGKDIVFEIGDDFKSPGINILSTTHERVNLANKPTVFVINGENVPLDITVTTATSTLDIELAIDKALQKAGFGYTVGAKVTDRNPSNPLSTMFDVTFTMQNVNVDRNTRLSTTYYDPKSTPETHDYQMATPPKNITSHQEERSVGDYMNFIRELYDDAVEVSMVDGRLMIQDSRGGESRLTVNINENNEGMGLPLIDDSVIVGGRYTGSVDNQWDVQLDMSRDADGSQRVHVVVKDNLGATIVDKTIDNYMGGEIPLRHGVTVVPDDMLSSGLANPSARFTLDLRGDASLNFGDMNIYEDGKNANMFQSLMNLYDAMMNAVTIDPAPSAWASESYKSTSIPYFDGKFGGNFNSTWKYMVEALDGRTDFFIQDEFGRTLDLPNYNANKSIASFEVEIYDNDTQEFFSKTMEVDLSTAKNQEDVQKLIIDAVNDDPDLHRMGAYAEIDDNGDLAINSGSGAKTINLLDFTMREPLKTTTEATTIDLDYFDGAQWRVQQVIIPAGRTPNQVVSAINTAIAGNANLAGHVSASISADGTLRFTADRAFEYTTTGGDLGLAKPMLAKDGAPLTIVSADTTFKLEYFDGTDWQTTNIAIPKDTTPADVQVLINNAMVPNVVASIVNGELQLNSSHPIRYNSIKGSDLGLPRLLPETAGEKIVSPSLSGLNDAQRTLNFNFNDHVAERSVSITLDAIDYDSPEELMDAVNAKLAEAGLDEYFTATVDEDGRLGFNTRHVKDFVIEGDYEGSLGFKKAGDKINMKVQDEKGRTIQNLSIDTANKEYSVSDGVLLGFDVGSMYATDSFTGTVGSAISHELGVLDLVERQLLDALTTTGTRQSRTESVINLSEMIIQNNQAQMDRAMGASDIDQIKLMTDFELATQAYEAALAMTSKVMSMSILDYLR
jgi:flagellin-like hook-associated protein FlgL